MPKKHSVTVRDQDWELASELTKPIQENHPFGIGVNRGAVITLAITEGLKVLEARFVPILAAIEASAE